MQPRRKIDVLIQPLGRTLKTRGAALVHDLVMGFLAMMLGLTLRLDIESVRAEIMSYTLACAVFGLLVGVVGLGFGMNRGVWRYASLPDLIAIVKVSSVSLAIFIVLHFLTRHLDVVPRSSMAITWAFLILFLATPRAVYRMYRNHRDSLRFRATHSQPRRRVLLIGASDEADLFMKALAERSRSAFEVLAIVDERGRRVGRFMRGVPILGDYERLPEIIQRFRAQERPPEALILARSRKEFERYASLETLIELASDESLELLRLPDMLDMHELNGEIDVRPVQLEDLLQRPPVVLDTPRVAEMLRGRKVLITGAGGSIGSELAHQIAAFGPSSLTLLDASEFLLYSVEQDLRIAFPHVPCHALLCNVREAGAVERIMQETRPAVVFHAAAVKHVPIVEAQPLEGVFTNVIGTRNVAKAAIHAGVSAVVMVSTDKAVNPANIMGATKRMAEMFCQAMDLDPDAASTRFMTVRFGNVLGSAGSVVPLFERQIKAGGPLTVTHPEIERYFMTTSEACLLVLQSAAHGLANPQERGRIFVLDMGSPIRIADLARNLIRLSGLKPDIDVKIAYTGLRPGEKLYEELFDSREMIVRTVADGIMAAFPRPIEGALIVRIFDEMSRLVAARDTQGTLRLLASTVHEFQPGAEAQRLMSEPVVTISDERPQSLH